MSQAELADDFLPVYDVSDAVATVTYADRETAWRAALDVDLLKLGREAPIVGMLGALRMLPEVVGHLLHGERPAKPPESMRLRDLPSIPMSEGGWILLGERPGEEIALGLVGKFWRPVIEFARIASADEFREFDEPGFAKTVYDLSLRELDPNRMLLMSVFEPGRALGLDGWGTFVLEPFGAGGTRLIVRGGVPRGVAAVAYGVLIEIPHFLMERRMLLGIKERAERRRA